MNKATNNDQIASGSSSKPGRGRRPKKPEVPVTPRRQSLRQAKQRSEENVANSAAKKPKKIIESSEEDEDDDWSIDDDDEDYLATMFKKLSKPADLDGKLDDEDDEDDDEDEDDDDLFQEEEHHDKDVYDFDQQSSIMSSRQVKDKKWLSQQAKIKSFKSLKAEPVSQTSWGSNIYSYLATFLNTRDDLDVYSRFLKCSYVNKSLDHTISDLCKPFRNQNNFEGATASLQHLMSRLNDNASVVGAMKEVMSDRFENAAHRISQLVLVVHQPVNGLQFYPKFSEILSQIDSKIVSESAFVVPADRGDSSKKTIPDMDTLVVTDSFYAFVVDSLLGNHSRGLQRVVVAVDPGKGPTALLVLDSWNRAGVPYNRTRLSGVPDCSTLTSNAPTGNPSLSGDFCTAGGNSVINPTGSIPASAARLEFLDGFFVRMGGRKDSLHLVTRAAAEPGKFLVLAVQSEHAFAFQKHGFSSKSPILLEGMFSAFAEVLGEEKTCLVVPDQLHRSLARTLAREVALPGCRFKKFVLLDKQTRAPLGVFFNTDLQLHIDPQTSSGDEPPNPRRPAMLVSLNGLLVAFELTGGGLGGPGSGVSNGAAGKTVAKCYELVSDANDLGRSHSALDTLFVGGAAGTPVSVRFCNSDTGDCTVVSGALLDNVPYCRRLEPIEQLLNELADRIFELPLQISVFDAVLRRLGCHGNNGGNGMISNGAAAGAGSTVTTRDDSCVFCGREFKAAANVYEHEIRHVGLIRYRCHKHRMVFPDLKSFRGHHDEFLDCASDSEPELGTAQRLLGVPSAPGPADCPQCDKCFDYFPAPGVLRTHRECCDAVSFSARTPLESRHESPGDAAAVVAAECFVCGLCGLAYSRLEVVAAHSAGHLACSVCRARLPGVDELSAHLAEHVARRENLSGPGKRKVLACDICGDFYGTKANYYHHQWQEHGVVHPPLKSETDGAAMNAAAIAMPPSATPGTAGAAGTATAPGALYKRRSKRVSELSYMATGTKKFPCKFCRAEVKVAGRDYVKHLDAKHGLSVGLDTLCRICADVCETPERLSDHLRDAHLQSGRYINAGVQSIFSCDKCSFFGHFRGVLAHAAAVHADPEPSLYECPHCPERLPDRRLWRIHLEKHDDSQLASTCADCGTYFRNEAARRLHLETFHGLGGVGPTGDQSVGESAPASAAPVEGGGAEQARFACPSCPERFVFENELQFHHQDAHGGLAQCDICQKLCKSAKAFELHRLKHFRTRIFQCTECQATFRSKLAMRRHIRVDHLHLEPERYECQICGKIVTQISMHMLIHKNARYQCEYCAKRFTKSAYYNEHVRIHKGEKPYECHICQRRFNKKSNLNVHINFHEKHRDDFGNYLEIKPRGRGHPDYDPQKTIARKNALKKVDVMCGPDIAVVMEHVLANSKGCDTADLMVTMTTGTATGTDEQVALTATATATAAAAKKRKLH